jgi:hypothetical protein
VTVLEGMKSGLTRGIEAMLSGTYSHRHFMHIVTKWGSVVPVLATCRMMMGEDGDIGQKLRRQQKTAETCSAWMALMILSRCMYPCLDGIIHTWSTLPPEQVSAAAAASSQPFTMPLR